MTDRLLERKRLWTVVLREREREREKGGGGDAFVCVLRSYDRFKHHNMPHF